MKGRFVSKNTDRIFQFWALTERLLLELPDKYSSCQIYQSYAMFILHLRYPIKNAEDYVLRAIQDGNESGNLMGGSVNAKLVLRVVKVAQAKSLGHASSSSSKKFINEMADSKLTIFAATVQLSMLISATLAGDRQDLGEESQVLQKKISQSENKVLVYTSYMALSDYYFFKEEFEHFIHFYLLWYKGSGLIQLDIRRPQIITISALALARCIPHASILTRWRYKRLFRSILDEIKWLSGEAPDNFLHFYLCLKGVEAKLNGQYINALKAFNAAIEHAKKGDFFLNVAVYNELAGDLLIEQEQPRCAQDYIREAHYYYQRYGMIMKVNSLQKRYAYCFLGQFSENTSTAHTSSTTSSSLDFMSVIKASQTISGEIVLEQLFEKMLHIVVENAGAERALFLENRKNTWMVTAILAKQEGVEVFNMLDVSLEEYQAIAHKVIKYVQRSAESVIISNAVEDQSYNDDPYIVQAQIKSILCVPIVLQDKVLGIIYLENNLSVGAFTQERVTVLSTLASQIAISLENARHFEVMEQLYRSTERFVPRGFLNLLNKKTIEDIKVGDSVEVNLAPMFADVRNFTTISEALGTEKTAYLLNAYMQLMSPIIRKHHGFVSQFLGDGIMALFPRHHVDALDAAIQMRSALVGFNEMIQSKGFDAIEIGIGINAGPAMLITLGEEERIDASVVSDVVNSASRIEGLNKFYGTGLLISDAVFASIKNPEQYVMRLVDKVRVKGRVQAMFIYEVMTVDQKEDIVSTREYIHAFEAAFKHYEAGDFKTATGELSTCLTTRPDDRVAMVLKSRCEDLLLSGLPKDWDGSFNALDK